MKKQALDLSALPKDNFFTEFVLRSGDRAVNKWVHYFEIYARELTRFRDRPVSFLEIGVFRGGSIPMWKAFFQAGSQLTFVDIDPECAQFEIPGTQVEIGSQADPVFLAELAQKYGPFDVVLDDGSHLNAHQIDSLQALWPHISEGGVYLVEDCHTSYWPGFGGGYRAPGSFVEHAKGLVDAIHSWYSEDAEGFPLSPRASDLHSVRFYDSIVAFERCARDGPPRMLHAKEGRVRLSRKWVDAQNRKSIFRGKDDGDSGGQ